MKKVMIAMAIAGALLIVVLLGVWTYVGYATTQDIEEPEYEVTQTAQEYEIRLYAPQIRAEVVIDGAYRESLYSGFRKLADYIFGNNTAQAKVAMTAPVLSEQSQKIAMTAPVLQEKQEGTEAHVVSFVMPSEYTFETLPKPNNEEVMLRQVPATRYAVLRFGGYATKGKSAARIQTLQDALARDGIKTTGAPQVAQYNPPWTPPFMRRNEILIALD